MIRLSVPDTTVCLGGSNKCKKEKKNGISVEMCCCTSDLCNSVSNVQLQLYVILGTTFFLIHQWM